MFLTTLLFPISTMMIQDAPTRFTARQSLEGRFAGSTEEFATYSEDYFKLGVAELSYAIADTTDADGRPLFVYARAVLTNNSSRDICVRVRPLTTYVLSNGQTMINYRPSPAFNSKVGIISTGSSAIIHSTVTSASSNINMKTPVYSWYAISGSSVKMRCALEPADLADWLGAPQEQLGHIVPLSD